MKVKMKLADAVRHKVLAVSAILLVLSSTAAPGNAEEKRPPAPVRLAQLPVVPSQEPRSAEEGEQRFRLKRPKEDSAPVTSLVDSVRGNDAVLEVVVGQARLLTTKQPIAGRGGNAVIAVGDPSIVDFTVLPNPRMLRILGRRAGVTDLSITTADGQVYSFEVHVGYDLRLLEAQLRQIFPDARLKLGQIRDHLVVEGEARSAAQVSDIIRAMQIYLTSAYVVAPTTASDAALPVPPSPRGMDEDPGNGAVAYAPNGAAAAGVLGAAPQIINLIRVPGVQQVMLQVRIAEVNRTGLREIGADIGLAKGGSVVGTSIGGATTTALGLLTGSGVSGTAAIAKSGSTTLFGIYPNSDFEIFIRALRDNSLLTIMAEPNLVAMSGHEASFLAGGQFPIPVPQSYGSGSTTTIQFKDFGVQLIFLPYVQDDDVIRLTVTPEVSSIDFSLGTTLVVGGDPVPGLNTRRAATTVEMRQGDTLAIAGLLSVAIDAHTSRIPGIGDVPYLGPLFSNTSHNRIEKELLVLVTPHLVAPLRPGQVPCLPGSEIKDPTDCEFYFYNRIENRNGLPYRSTTAWDDPQLRIMEHEKKAVCGPVGYSDCQ